MQIHKKFIKMMLFFYMSCSNIIYVILDRQDILGPVHEKDLKKIVFWIPLLKTAEVHGIGFSDV